MNPHPEPNAPRKRRICELCNKEVRKVTRHHLIPQTRHRNKRNKRNFTREQVQRVVMLCTNCHNQIHAVLTEKELEYDYNTLGKLRAHADIARYLAWAEGRDLGKIPVRKKNRP